MSEVMCKVYFAHSFTFKMAAGTSKRLESTVSPLDNGVGGGASKWAGNLEDWGEHTTYCPSKLMDNFVKHK